MSTTPGLHNIPCGQFIHLKDIRPRSRAKVAWDRMSRRQGHWIGECVAEFVGVFVYVYTGIGSTAGFALGNATGISGLSSIFQIGLAYGLGIVFAVVISASTSGGHFSPAMTLANTATRGFPLRKCIRYIIAQILGAYVASLVIYVQYGDHIGQITEALRAAGKLDEVMFTPQGPAGIFAIYVPPGSNLGRVFLNEFVSDFVLGLVIFAALDPTNYFSSPLVAPWVVGMAYAVMVWGYANVGIATNASRDIGARLMAMTIWGPRAAGGSYAAIAALTNIPATLLAVYFYDFFLTDHARVITPVNMAYFQGHIAYEDIRRGVVHPVSSVTSIIDLDDSKGHGHAI